MIVALKLLDDLDKKIVRKAAEACTSKEIGRDLNISPRIVEARIREMKKYYGCRSLTELIVKVNSVQHEQEIILKMMDTLQPILKEYHANKTKAAVE